MAQRRRPRGSIGNRIDLWLALGFIATISGIAGGYFGLRWLWNRSVGGLYQADLGYIPPDEFRSRFVLSLIIGAAVLGAAVIADGIVHGFPPRITRLKFILGSTWLCLMLGLIFVPYAETEVYHFQPKLESYAATSHALSQAPIPDPPPVLPADARVAIVDFKDSRLALNRLHARVKDQHRATRPNEVNMLLFVDWGEKIGTTHQRDATVNGPGATTFTSERYQIHWQLIDVERSQVFRRGSTSIDAAATFDLPSIIPEVFP